MKKAYYILNMRKIWGEWYEGVYTPPEGEPFLPSKALQQHLRSLQQTGSITTAHEIYELKEVLVGWTGYIILSLGKCGHWKEHFHQKSLFGFIFNAQDLIEQGAVLAAENVVAEYDRIITEAIKRVASTLPPAPEISKELLDLVMKSGPGEDLPHIREYLKQKSRNPLPDLLKALETGDLEFPGCRQVIEEVQRKVQAMNVQKLLKSNAALAYLNNALEDGSCQLLVWKRLSVDRAIGTVQQGEEIFL